MKNIFLAMTVSIALPHAAAAQIVSAPAVPANLQVQAPDQPFLIAHAVGTQNYICQPTDSLGAVAWTLFTPEATLFDDGDEQLATHFFSPNPNPNPDEHGKVRATWQDSRDTSAVWGAAVASSKDPSFVNQNAIAWLRVESRGTMAGPNGGGTLSATTFIQRVNTSGGLAPAAGCRIPTDIGNRTFVPYSADYVFYKN